MNSFIKKSKLKFNERFSYTNLNYITTKKSIQLTCIKHSNTFTITTRSHLDSEYGGCIECDKEYRAKLFINKSKEKYNDKYIIDEKLYINYTTQMKMICSLHGSFTITPNNHILYKNGGCNKCTPDKITKIKNIPKKKNKLEIDIKSVKINKEQIKERQIFNNNKIIIKSDEIFKLLNIKDYENLYKISNYGNIFSIKKNKYMKLYENPDGYNLVRLHDNFKKTKLFRVHRLISLLFIDNSLNKPYIDHINHIRNDNYYKNLRWVNHQENMVNYSKNNIYTHNIIKNINNNSNKDNLINNQNYKNIGIIDICDLSNYKINEYGNIINILSNNIVKYTIHDGYATVALFNKNNNKYVQLRVHRLVSYIFVDKPIEFTYKYVVNHIDNNRLNNYFKNLEWCTSKENTIKYFTKNILQIDIATNNILNKFNTFTEACIYLGKPYNSDISKCCKGIYKNAHGYKWIIQD